MLKNKTHWNVWNTLKTETFLKALKLKFTPRNYTKYNKNHEKCNPHGWANLINQRTYMIDKHYLKYTDQKRIFWLNTYFRKTFKRIRETSRFWRLGRNHIRDHFRNEQPPKSVGKTVYYQNNTLASLEKKTLELIIK